MSAIVTTVMKTLVMLYGAYFIVLYGKNKYVNGKL